MKITKWPVLFLTFILMMIGCAPASIAEPHTLEAPSAVTQEPTAPPVISTTAPPPNSRTLVIMAAASLTESFTEIGKSYEAANPGVTVVFNFAGSQDLAQQIINGAPADVFASANKKQMAVVAENEMAVETKSKIFVRNLLVVITPAANPANIETLQDLTKPGVKLILADKEVPVGQYSLDFLKKASETPEFGSNYQAEVIKNVVTYENTVKSVLSKIVLGEGDAGIVYKSDITRDAFNQVIQIEIPEQLNVVAFYPIAPLANSPEPELAQDFINYVLSMNGQKIMEKYGFLPAE